MLHSVNNHKKSLLLTQSSMLRKLHYCFWLVILAHLILFLGLTLKIFYNETPEMYAARNVQKILPAYFYKDESNPTQQNNFMQETQTKKMTADNGILKQTKDSIEKNLFPPQDIKRKAKIAEQSAAPEQAPVNLIADKSTDKPLIKLLSRAAAKNLVYPKSARDFLVTGTAHIQFYIFPDGRVSNITLLQSSGSSVLDDAALFAIREMSPVRGVSLYLPAARYITVGIIFSA
jgi:TonB family protein